MKLPEIITVDAHYYSDGNIEKIEASVSSEYHMVLKINGNPFVSIACSGADMEMLAVGHLISEGIVYSRDEINRITIDDETLEVDVILNTTDDILERLFRIRSIASGCGQGPGSRLAGGEINYKIDGQQNSIEPLKILTSMNEFLHASNHHKLTHGVHSAALFDLQWNQLFFSDEIGRHNAVDKIIGFSFVNRIPLNDKLIFSTGRLSSEILLKGLTAGILGIFSKSTPTSRSVELANQYNLLLIGKISRTHLIIYSGRDKLKIKQD